MTRVQTTPGELARRGFHDPVAAAAMVQELDLQPSEWELFDAVADPDLALTSWHRLAEAVPDLTVRLRSRPAALARVLGVLGASHALAAHLQRVPEQVATLLEEPVRWAADRIRDDLLESVGAAPDPEHPELLVASTTEPGGTSPVDRLRIAHRRHLLRVAARDLSSPDPVGLVDDVAAELSDLADGIVQAALAVARLEVPQHARARLGVVALGKCGAQELNYLSDVDVLFVAEPADPDTSTEVAMQVATKLAGALTQTCSRFTSTGTIWELDAALRPEGKAGPLVRTLASMEAYYRKWAHTWEFQAMLKARPMAGDLALGQAFVDLVQPLVWRAAERDHFMAETQAMRRRVIATIPAKERAREIKLGEGGLRDTEFTVQLLQLVHGRTDEQVRVAGTVPALRALVERCYIGRADGAELEAAYRLQRTLEHRVQLWRMRRTHLLPDDPGQLRVLARSLLVDGERVRGPEEVTALWRASAVRVRRLHQRIFYSPLLQAVARISSSDLALSPAAARDRMRAIGFHDPDAALRHVQALTTGSSRRSQIQRQLMPAMLGWFASAPNPDHGMLAFRQLSESLGDSPWYLRALRDEGEMAERLATLLSSSRLVVDLLKRAPDAVALLADSRELTPRPLDDLTVSMRAVAARHQASEDAVKAVRALRRRELLRIAVADLTGTTDVVGVGRALSDLASATLDGVLDVARREVDGAPALGVVAMGRWGGRELAYGSDADVMFVVPDTDDPEALRRAGQLVTRVRAWLGAPGADPGLDLDPDLRPEGKGGAMVRTLSSYLAYYRRWSDTWEAQALVRAAPAAGDRTTVAALLDGINPLRWPDGGLSRHQLADIRKLKARMEKERMPRGADPRRNLKLGPGGLSDVEWTVQLLQLQHAGAHPSLRTTETLTALAAAVEAELIESSAAETLREAWLLASRIRNAVMLTRGRASDTLPIDVRELSAIASLLGHAAGQASELEEEHRRATRRAARVVDHYFWGRS